MRNICTHIGLSLAAISPSLFEGTAVEVGVAVSERAKQIKHT